ncbi:pyridoxamine 5'-phosphate oxidase family protein [Pseudoteredinibacter isoporae]|uniref:pyridoxamine 5'-phosphate oxidase family protein n=1 Tax=Pseudoteredinibacter isoporae TaxID=570281 RepID=UPI0031075A77
MSNSEQLSPLQQSEKTRLRRSPKRAVFDREALYQIFDEAMVAHVGFVQDGQSYVIPMLVWRWGNRLLIHGSNGSRMIKALCGEQSICITATLLDGMVLAKSAFHHSSNYRSAMVMGSCYVLDDEQDIEQSLEVFMELIAPGRWPHLRPPNENELAATTILAMDIEEASVKIRSGGPVEDDGDLDWPVWTGELQLRQSLTAAVTDAHSVGEMQDYSAAWGERWSL